MLKLLSTVALIVIPSSVNAEPITLGLIAAGVSGAGIAGTSISVASILSYAIVTAAGLGLKMLLAPSEKKAKGNPEQYNIKQAMPPRTRGYGQFAAAGPFAAFEDFGGVRRALSVHCEGPVHSIQQWLVDNKIAAIDSGSFGGPANIAPWFSYVTLDSRIGTSNQTVSGLMTALPYWTTNHKLNGLCYTVKMLGTPPKDKISKFFPNGDPQLRVVIYGPRCYDPRDVTQNINDDFWNPTTWLFQQNASLCILDYLRSPRGFAFTNVEINFTSFATFANVCSQAVGLAEGGIEERYRVSGTYTLDEPRGDVLRRLLDACDGDLYTVNGQICIRGGVWEDPTSTITGDFIKAYEYTVGNERLSETNQLKFSYTSIIHDYQTIPGDPWDDLTSQNQTGEVMTDDFDLRMVPSHGQARRLSKIEMHKRAPKIQLSLEIAAAAGLRVWGDRIIRVRIPNFNPDAAVTPFPELFDGTGKNLDATFRVLQHQVGDNLLANHMLTLVSFTVAAYTWNPATEQGVTPALPNLNQPADTIPAPVNLSTVVERRVVSGASSVVFVKLTAIEPTREDYHLIGRYRIVGDSVWINMEANTDSRGSVTTGVLSEGSTYEFEGAITSNGESLQSAWVSAGSVFAVTDTVAPGPLAGFTVNGGAGQAVINWVNPNSQNYASTRIYFTTTNVFTGATIITTKFNAPSVTDSFTWFPPAGTYYFWGEARNSSSVAGARSGPVSAVVT